MKQNLIPVFSAIDEAGETKQVAAESGTVMKHIVKPSELPVEETDNQPYKEHGEQCAGSDNIP